MKVSLGTRLIDDAVIKFDGSDADNAWITVHLGDGRPSAQVNIIQGESGLQIDVYPMLGEVEEPASGIVVYDNELSKEWAEAEEVGDCDRCARILRRTADGLLIDYTGGDVCEDTLPHVLEVTA